MGSVQSGVIEKLGRSLDPPTLNQLEQTALDIDGTKAPVEIHTRNVPHSTAPNLVHIGIARGDSDLCALAEDKIRKQGGGTPLVDLHYLPVECR